MNDKLYIWLQEENKCCMCCTAEEGVQDYVKGLVEGLCMGGTKDSQLGSV